MRILWRVLVHKLQNRYTNSHYIIIICLASNAIGNFLYKEWWNKQDFSLDIGWNVWPFQMQWVSPLCIAASYCTACTALITLSYQFLLSNNNDLHYSSNRNNVIMLQGGTQGLLDVMKRGELSFKISIASFLFKKFHFKRSVTCVSLETFISTTTTVKKARFIKRNDRAWPTWLKRDPRAYPGCQLNNSYSAGPWGSSIIRRRYILLIRPNRSWVRVEFHLGTYLLLL